MVIENMGILGAATRLAIDVFQAVRADQLIGLPR
jgi:hypothetical protein